MWRQVKGERGRDRGRDAFNDEMLSNQAFVDFAVSWWPPLDAPEVLSWLRDPDFLARVGEGVVSAGGPAAARQVVERRRLAVRGGRAAARRAALRARRRARRGTRTTTSSTTTSVPTCQELTTAVGPRVRPDRPGLDAADAPDRGRRVRARPDRRGAGPHPDAVADGRPARPHRLLDDRRRPGPVVVAGARPSRPPPAPRRWRARTSTSSTCPPTTGTPRRSTSTPRRTPSGSGWTPTCRPRSARPASSRRCCHRRRRRRGGHPRGRGRDRRARSPARSGSWCRSRAGRRSTPGWRPGRSSPTTPPAARAAVDSDAPPSGEDRIVVLTGLDTKGLEFDGIVVVAPAGDRGRVRHRPGHALRRPHPRHPAPHHHQLTPTRRWSRDGRCATSRQPTWFRVVEDGAPAPLEPLIGTASRSPVAVSRVFGHVSTPQPPRCARGAGGDRGDAAARGVGDRSGVSPRAGDRHTVTLVGGNRSEVESLLDVPLEDGPPPEGRSVRPAGGDPVPAGGRAWLRGPRRRHPAGRGRRRDRARVPGRGRARGARGRPGSTSPTGAASRPTTTTTPTSSSTIIRDEIGQGEGANLVIGRHYRATVADWGAGEGADRLPPAARARARRLLDLLLLHRRPLPDRRQPGAARQRARRRRPDEPDQRHLPDRRRADRAS